MSSSPAAAPGFNASVSGRRASCGWGCCCCDAVRDAMRVERPVTRASSALLDNDPLSLLSESEPRTRSPRGVRSSSVSSAERACSGRASVIESPDDVNEEPVVKSDSVEPKSCRAVDPVAAENETRRCSDRLRPSRSPEPSDGADRSFRPPRRRGATCSLCGVSLMAKRSSLPALLKPSRLWAARGEGGRSLLEPLARQRLWPRGVCGGCCA